MALAVAFGIVAAAQQNRPVAPVAVRVLLQPKFTPGQVMRYRMTLESDSSTRQSGSVKDPQGSSALDIVWDATIRLAVSHAEGNPGAASPGRGATAAVPLRLRITYESSQATVRSDAPDPRSAGILQQYAQLAGRSFEFTLAPGGEVSDIRGLEGLVTDDQARAAVQQWIAQLSSASATPQGGIAPGQKWNATQPADLPLAGLSWRTDSTYLRNEPCSLATPAAANPAAAAPPQRADCAVILSRLALITTRAVRDATPETYRTNGLRTSGRWTGTGQGMMYVSLDTGWIVSNTQDTTQEMDVTIAEAAPNSANAVRHSGRVTMRSQISLLSAPTP